MVEGEADYPAGCSSRTPDHGVMVWTMVAGMVMVRSGWIIDIFRRSEPTDLHADGLNVQYERKEETEVRNRLKVLSLSNYQMELSFPGKGKMGQKQASRLGIRNSGVDILNPNGY